MCFIWLKVHPFQATGTSQVFNPIHPYTSAIYAPLAVKLVCQWESRARPGQGASFRNAPSSRESISGRMNELYNSGAGAGMSDGERNLTRSVTMHKVYYVSSVRCRSRWGLTDAVLKGIHEMGLEILDFRIHTKGGWTLMELYLKDPELEAPNEPSSERGGGGGAPLLTDDEDKAALEANDRVDQKLDKMRLKLENFVFEGDGPGTPKTPGGEDSRGEVMFERWHPALDDENPSNDDALAFEKAEETFHEEYPEEEKLEMTKKVGPGADYALATSSGEY